MNSTPEPNWHARHQELRKDEWEISRALFQFVHETLARMDARPWDSSPVKDLVKAADLASKLGRLAVGLSVNGAATGNSFSDWYDEDRLRELHRQVDEVFAEPRQSGGTSSVESHESHPSHSSHPSHPPTLPPAHPPTITPSHPPETPATPATATPDPTPPAPTPPPSPCDLPIKKRRFVNGIDVTNDKFAAMTINSTNEKLPERNGNHSKTRVPAYTRSPALPPTLASALLARIA